MGAPYIYDISSLRVKTVGVHVCTVHTHQVVNSIEYWAAGQLPVSASSYHLQALMYKTSTTKCVLYITLPLKNLGPACL